MSPAWTGPAILLGRRGCGASATPGWPRWRHIHGGPGELLDLSMLETQILCLTYYPVTYFEVLGRPWRDTRRPSTSK
ncbi:hypothetical protein MAHJHV51_55080 [Mycobacterium avium subsp. hominissuis]